MRNAPPEDVQRRDFLRRIGGIAAVPLLGSWSAPARGAGPYDDYRALVCLVMYGGNDAHNMIVPLDARYAAYAAARGPLALPQASLLANAVSDPVQGPFGFHPRMPRTRALFADGEIAVISNVGVLLRPTTKFDYQNRSQLPPLLFAHDNMQEHWFTAHPQAPVEDGWGGRLADLLRSANTGLSPVSISASSSGVLLKGGATSGHRILPYHPPSAIVQRILSYNWHNTKANPQAVYEAAITMARTNVLQDQFDAQHSALRPSGNEPAILYGNHADNLGLIDAALQAFYDATIELGVQDKVTTFTASEFGRTLTSNGKGSDHGWGGHHLVMGGAVKGGKIYGTFHNMEIGSGNPADAGQGRLIPDISVDQYAATLSKWMGANPAELGAVFPNLANFGGLTDLGFMA